MAMSRKEIFDSVQETLVDALAVEPEEVTEEATLTGDLGAESIDFLDIVFRLEKALNIKIPRGELFPESIFQGDPEFVQDGKITPKGLAELKARMPYADLSKFENDPDFEGLRDLFTVDLISRYIRSKLAPSNN